jgi:hypothetical protein
MLPSHGVADLSPCVGRCEGIYVSVLLVCIRHKCMGMLLVYVRCECVRVLVCDRLEYVSMLLVRIRHEYVSMLLVCVRCELVLVCIRHEFG